MTVKGANWFAAIRGKQVCTLPKGDKILIIIDNRLPGIDLDLRYWLEKSFEIWKHQ
jgi:hypothetical protein